MARTGKNQTKSRLIKWGPALITLFVVTSGVTDPVNVTKLLLTGMFAFGLLAAVQMQEIRDFLRNQKMVAGALFLFTAAAISSLSFSKAPLSQSWYGVYGRNNGFALYLFLVMIFFAITLGANVQNDYNVVFSICLAGIVNLVYCLWVIGFGDFLSWTNPYGNILGTLGNPNFIGSFLGIFGSVLVSLIIHFRKQLNYTLFLIFIYLVNAFVIFESKAIQGRILLFFGLGLNILLFLISEVKKRIITLTYLGGFLTVSLLAALGALQKGPLTKYIYKNSVSLRGEYWNAGINIGNANPWHGVGFDSYGDYYRQSRRASALVRPGVETVSNTAHNVFIDLFAFGGYPLLITYCFLNIIVLISIIHQTLRLKKFEFTFAGISVAWVGYQLQSIISINQIGLAVWGWVFGAVILSRQYSESSLEQKYEKDSKFKKMKDKSLQNDSLIGIGTRVMLGLLVGALISSPPLSADVKWRSAQLTSDAIRIEDTLKPTYINPPNTFKYLNVVGALEESGLHDMAYKNAIKAVEFNPHSYESWRLLVLLKNTPDSEKQIALQKMKKLDPKNPKILDPAK